MINNLLDKGWHLLKPSVYNLFYHLNNFLNSFCRNFVTDRKNIQKHFDFIESFSKSFFVLMTDKKYLRDMREGIYLFYGHKESEQMMSFLLFVEGLLDKKKKFSFINYILMIYSSTYRSPINVSNILETKEIDKVQATNYLIVSRVKSKVQSYLKKISKKQEVNEKKLFYLKHIQDDNTSMLEKFIKSHAEQKFSIEYFTTDLLRSAKEFLHAFLVYSRDILLHEITVSKNQNIEKVNIFKNVWITVVNDLEEIVKEINYYRQSYKYLFISLATYEEYLANNRHVKSEKDEKLCEIIYRSEKKILDVFEVITTILYNDFKLTYNERKEEIFEQLKNRNKAINETESVRLIPFSDYSVQEYNGETVLNILSIIAASSGTFLYILGDKKIIDKLHEKNSLIQNSKSNIENLMRITVKYE